MKILGLNSTNPDERWGVLSPTPCYILKFVSLYCVLLFAASITFNTLLLWVFYKHKELRTTLNILIIALTAYNLFASLVELPMVIVSNFQCRWPFGKVGCHVTGVIMYAVGCIQIYLLAAISFERFFIIYKPLSIKSINTKNIMIAIFFCTVLGTFWALCPYFGWSYYSLEGALTSCSIEWYERSFNVISYNVTIFLFVFVIPLIVIAITNVKLLLIIKSLPKINKDLSSDPKAKKRLATERNLTILMIMMIFGFVVSWTPYAMVSVYSSFIATDLPPLAGTLPAMFAKSTLVWSAVLYIFSNKQIRLKLKIFAGKKETPTEEVSISRDKTVMNQPTTAQTA